MFGFDHLRTYVEQSTYLTETMLFIALGIVFGLVLLTLRYSALKFIDYLYRDIAPDTGIRRFPNKGLTKATHFLFLQAVGIYLALRFTQLEPETVSVLNKGILLVVVWQVARWIGVLVNAVRDDVLRQHVKRGQTSNTATVNFAGMVARFVVWVLALLVVLDNFGVNITALIAGLGVGGIAVALAAQNMLGNLFASLTMLVDKPFVVGDYITLNNGIAGVIENIGVTSSRLRALSGEQIVAPNSELVKCWVNNFQRIRERRNLVLIGVEYGTAPEQVEKIPEILKAAVEAQEKTRFDRAHFKTFGASSLDFELVYFVTEAPYLTFMNVQQAVNLYIMRAFAKEGISFAFPSQTTYLRSETPFAIQSKGA